MITIKHKVADRAIIRLSGEDRRDFLQGLTTQDIAGLTPENAAFTALLTPQGKILFDFFIADVGDDFLIDCCKEAAPALVKRLTLYKLRAKVVIEIDETLSVSTSPDSLSAPDGVAFADPRLAELGWRAITAHEIGEDSDAYQKRRIALGVPEFGADFASDEMFLLDVNYDALNGVSYQKGCFVGQEVTSRMKRKGDARRRTLIAEFDEAAAAKGTPVTAGDSSLGETLSAHKDQALAMIRLDRWEKAKAANAMSVVDGKPVRLSVPDYLEQD